MRLVDDDGEDDDNDDDDDDDDVPSLHHTTTCYWYCIVCLLTVLIRYTIIYSYISHSLKSDKYAIVSDKKVFQRIPFDKCAFLIS